MSNLNSRLCANRPRFVTYHVTCNLPEKETFKFFYDNQTYSGNVENLHSKSDLRGTSRSLSQRVCIHCRRQIGPGSPEDNQLGGRRGVGPWCRQRCRGRGWVGCCNGPACRSNPRPPRLRSTNNAAYQLLQEDSLTNNFTNYSYYVGTNIACH